MNHIRTRLADGVHLTCLTSGQYKSAVLSAGFVLPLTKDNTYAALLPQVLRRGTERDPDMRALGCTLDGLYGARVFPCVRKNGDALFIGMLADIIDEAYVPAGEHLTARLAALLYDFWHAPCRDAEGLLHSDYTAAEGQFLADRIAAQKNETRSYAVRRVQEIMCAEEPYGCNEYGVAAAAREADAERLTQLWQETIAAAPVELFYCGSMAADAAAECFRSFGQAAPRRAMPENRAHIREGAVRTVTEEMNVTQGKLSLGFQTGLTGRDAAYPALMLFSMVFGGYTGSRLFRHVREKRSLCYYASSALDKFKGIMIVSSGIENENAGIVQEEVLCQLRDLQNGNLTQDELEAARRALCHQLRAMKDNPASLEYFFQSQAAGGFSSDPDGLVERIEQVTREEVLDAGRRAALDTVYFLKGVAK